MNIKIRKTKRQPRVNFGKPSLSYKFLLQNCKRWATDRTMTIPTVKAKKEIWSALSPTMHIQELLRIAISRQDLLREICHGGPHRMNTTKVGKCMLISRLIYTPTWHSWTAVLLSGKNQGSALPETLCVSIALSWFWENNFTFGIMGTLNLKEMAERNCTNSIMMMMM